MRGSESGMRQRAVEPAEARRHERLAGGCCAKTTGRRQGPRKRTDPSENAGGCTTQTQQKCTETQTRGERAHGRLALRFSQDGAVLGRPSLAASSSTPFSRFLPYRLPALPYRLVHCHARRPPILRSSSFLSSRIVASQPPSPSCLAVLDLASARRLCTGPPARLIRGPIVRCSCSVPVSGALSGTHPLRSCIWSPPRQRRRKKKVQ